MKEAERIEYLNRGENAAANNEAPAVPADPEAQAPAAQDNNVAVPGQDEARNQLLSPAGSGGGP